MRVLVFELDHSGHKLHYVAKLVQGLAQLAGAGVRPILATTGEVLSSPEYRVHLQPLEGLFNVDSSFKVVRASPLRFAAHALATLKRAVRRLRPEYLYIPYADGLSQVMGAQRLTGADPLPPELPAEGLMMRGSAFYPASSRTDRLRHRLSWDVSMRARWNRLHHLDPLVIAAGRHAGGPARLMHLMPEAVESQPSISRAAARQMLNMPGDGLLAGSLGIQDERKGIDRLIRAFVDADAAGRIEPTSRLLLIGRQSIGIAKLLAGPAASLVASGRIIAQDRYVEQHELAAALAAVDLVCTPYPRHIGSASIVVRAAHARRPVLASDQGWCGYIVPRFELGRVVNVLDPSAFAASLVEALRDASGYKPSAAGERFVQFHTIENFQAAWTEGIRRRLNLAPPAGRMTWRAALGHSSLGGRQSSC